MELKKEKIKDTSLSIIYAIIYLFFILTLAIGFVLLYRPFFYCQINFLYLPQYTGKTYLELKEAYNALMNSMIFFDEFSLGVFEYSEAGKNHFLDCRSLFLLNNVVLIVTSILMIVFFILKITKVFKEKKYHGFTLRSYFLFGFILLALIIVILCSINFDNAFRIFHQIFFPGKTNWIFDPETDPIINMFQEAFFINCAIAIVVIFLLLALIPIIKDIKGIIINKKISQE